MRLAAIETATAATAVAVGDGDDVTEVLADDRRRHTEALAPCLAELLAARGWTPHDLDAVVVDVGPGLFTGLRVGVATAKGLAVATGVGLVATTSTDALAEAARVAGVEGDLVAVVDVRRGEVVWASYRIGPDAAVPATTPTLATPAVLAAQLAGAGARPVAVGDGATRHADVLRGAVASVREDLVLPSPAAALRLARRRLEAGEQRQRHDEVHVRYAREADAVANFAVRGDR